MDYRNAENVAQPLMIFFSRLRRLRGPLPLLPPYFFSQNPRIPSPSALKSLEYLVLLSERIKLFLSLLPSSFFLFSLLFPSSPLFFPFSFSFLLFPLSPPPPPFLFLALPPPPLPYYRFVALLPLVKIINVPSVAVFILRFFGNIRFISKKNRLQRAKKTSNLF